MNTDQAYADLQTLQVQVIEIADWLDSQLDDEYKSRQWLCEQVEQRLRGLV